MGINPGSDFLKVFDSVRYSYNATSDKTDIAQQASTKSDSLDNQTAVTVALNDFSVFATNFGRGGVLTISQREMKPGFFASIFQTNKDNVFRSDVALEYAADGGTINRHDIFKMTAANEGGLRYADDGDNIYEAALNFAKADIASIEHSYRQAGYSNHDKGELNTNESRQMDTDAYNTPERMFGNLDLDGDSSTMSPEEYASYLIACETLIQLPATGEVGHNVNTSTVDGLLTNEEIELASWNEEELRKAAQEIYDAHYKN